MVPTLQLIGRLCGWPNKTHQWALSCLALCTLLSPLPVCPQLANSIAGWSSKLLQLPLKDKSTPWLMLEQLYDIKQLPGSEASKDAVEMMLCTAADSFDGNFHDVLVSAIGTGQQMCIWL